MPGIRVDCIKGAGSWTCAPLPRNIFDCSTEREGKRYLHRAIPEKGSSDQASRYRILDSAIGTYRGTTPFSEGKGNRRTGRITDRGAEKVKSP